MATIDQLKQALITADKAGNTTDAQMLAKAIRSMQPSAPSIEEISGNPPPLTPEQAAEQDNIRQQATVSKKFEDLPWYQKPIQAAGDLAQIAGSAGTLGLLDKIPKMGQETQDAWTRAGSAGIPAALL